LVALHNNKFELVKSKTDGGLFYFSESMYLVINFTGKPKVWYSVSPPIRAVAFKVSHCKPLTASGKGIRWITWCNVAGAQIRQHTIL